MTQHDGFDIQFWGVRGTLPTPFATHLRYGGNTSCVQMCCAGHTLIFDAGTGLYPLGESERILDADLFLSHTHIDHILGFMFFSPMFDKQASIRCWAGHLKAEGRNLKDTLARLISPPIFPLTMDFFKADLCYTDFTAGETIDAPHLRDAGIRITTLPLLHPDRATGYRVDYAGKSACYITDIEHLRDGLDQALVEFVRDADLFIYDSTFDDEHFDRFIGWGHSTWQEAMRIADAANVKQLALFHHDPGCDDDTLDARAEKLQAARPQDCVAKEGMVVRLV